MYLLSQLHTSFLDKCKAQNTPIYSFWATLCMLLLGMKNEVMRLTVSTDSPFSCSDPWSGEASFSLLYSIQTAAVVKHAAVGFCTHKITYRVWLMLIQHTHKYTVLWNTHVLVCSPIDSKFKKVPVSKIGILWYSILSNFPVTHTEPYLVELTSDNWSWRIVPACYQ